MIVRFASVSDVREFVGLATLQPYAIDVVDGEHVVSAKNFMELFTINFTHPLQVQIADSRNEAHFAKAAARFVVGSIKCRRPHPIGWGCFLHGFPKLPAAALPERLAG